MTAVQDPLAPFRERWSIAVRPACLRVWTAEHRSDDGRHIRYLVAPSAAELAEKPRAAEES